MAYDHSAHEFHPAYALDSDWCCSPILLYPGVDVSCMYTFHAESDGLGATKAGALEPHII